MYKIPFEELKERILKSGQITPRDFDTRIKQKINELSGLISEEGAAHILANELGLETTPAEKAKLKIKEIYAGMRNVGAVGKVVRKFEIREFVKGESKGKVCSILLGDETGTIRTVFWNDQVDKIAELKEDDILEVKNCYVRENQGGRELHLGDKGTININPEGVQIESVRKTTEVARKPISNLSAGESNVEIMGTIVQIFDPRFFSVCGSCNKKVTEQEGAMTCAEHGKVEPTLSYVLNLILDDGSGNIRTVLWKNQTDRLLNKPDLDFNAVKTNLSLFEESKTDLLGEQYKFIGRVTKNDMFDRLEFNVQLVEKADPQEELKKLEAVK
ncbi:hypothetical protein HYV86_05915 [Candidatus Woesearchaeota archaeon]|nr:hypothetical protein [Candidatus Woesearchaeota archaeon]